MGSGPDGLRVLAASKYGAYHMSFPFYENAPLSGVCVVLAACAPRRDGNWR